MNEYPRAAEWLTAALTTPPIAGVAGVFEHPAPQGTTGLYVTFQAESGEDLAVINENRIWADFLFLVRATKATRSTAELKAVADAIDARLHRADGVTADGRVLSSVRSGPYHDTEVTDGVTYKHLGGHYALLVQPL